MRQTHRKGSTSPTSSSFYGPADERQNKTPGLAAEGIAEINLKLSPVIISSTGNIKLISHFALYLGQNLSPLINWAHSDWMTITANLRSSVNYIYLTLKSELGASSGQRVPVRRHHQGRKKTTTTRKIVTMTMFCTTVELIYLCISQPLLNGKHIKGPGNQFKHF